MDDMKKLVKQAISHFRYGVSHDIFSEPVKTYAKLAIEALEKENGVTAPMCKSEDKKTNADRIRAMTDGELALWICGVYDIEEENGKFINGIIIPGYAPHDIEEWLQQPVVEADNGKEKQ